MGIVKRDSSLITIVSYVGVIIGYVNKVLLFPNFLQPDQVGLANIMVSIAILYAQFSALGTTGITLKFFPYFHDAKRHHHGFLYWGSIVVAVGFAVVTLLFLLFQPLVVAKLGRNSPLLVEYYYYLIPLALSTVFFQFFDAYLRSLLKTVFPSFVYEVVLRLLVTLSITLYALNWVDFKNFVLIYVALNSSIAFILLFYMISIKQLLLKPVRSFRLKKMHRPMILFGLISILSSGGNTLIANLDSLMIAGLMSKGLYYAGIYTTVFFISTVILIPYRSMLKITGPIVSNHWKKNQMEEMDKLYKQVTLVNLMMGMFLFILLWTCIDHILSFMPPAFASGKYVFLYISLGRLFDMATGINGVIILTSNKYKYDLLFTLFLLILTVFSNYFFIQVMDMGMEGSAIATMITLVMFNILRIWFVWYHFDIHLFSWPCVWLILIGLWTVFCVSLVPFIHDKYLDSIIRGLLILLLYVAPVLYFKLVPDVNEMVLASYKKLPFLKK
jgi:O-antigen/teichoic acid export membrane protein